jgi:hypothetical protein
MTLPGSTASGDGDEDVSPQGRAGALGVPSGANDPSTEAPLSTDEAMYVL